MKKLIFVAIILITSMLLATTAFYTGEFVSGMKKTCVYDCLGSEVFISISAYKLCPLSIQTSCM